MRKKQQFSLFFNGLDKTEIKFVTGTTLDSGWLVQGNVSMLTKAKPPNLHLLYKKTCLQSYACLSNFIHNLSKR